MQIDIVEAGALVTLPGGYDARLELLRKLYVVGVEARRRPDGRLLIVKPERFADKLPALGAALDDYKRQLRMF